jgi:putative flippase GtrA
MVAYATELFCVVGGVGTFIIVAICWLFAQGLGRQYLHGYQP